MKDFCIIGSGISGATIANILSKKYSLDVYDKARGVGGEDHLIKSLIRRKVLIMAFNIFLQKVPHLKGLSIILLQKK